MPTVCVPFYAPLYASLLPTVCVAHYPAIASSHVSAMASSIVSTIMSTKGVSIFRSVIPAYTNANTVTVKKRRKKNK